jgi:hypothetical protein
MISNISKFHLLHDEIICVERKRDISLSWLSSCIRGLPKLDVKCSNSDHAFSVLLLLLTLLESLYKV